MIMDRLLELISQFENDESECLSTENPIVKEISSLAESLLITHEGKCNWENIEQLIDRSIDVFPVESDRFGWLIGGISTIKGIITYG